MTDFEELKNLIDPHKQADKEFFLNLLDEENQITYENRHIDAVMKMLRFVRLGALKTKLIKAREEKESLARSTESGGA